MPRSLPQFPQHSASEHAQRAATHSWQLRNRRTARRDQRCDRRSGYRTIARTRERASSEQWEVHHCSAQRTRLCGDGGVTLTVTAGRVHRLRSKTRPPSFTMATRPVGRIPDSFVHATRSWHADGEMLTVREVVATVPVSPPPTRALLAGPAANGGARGGASWAAYLSAHFGVAGATSYSPEGAAGRLLSFGDAGCAAYILPSGRIIATVADGPERAAWTTLSKAVSLTAAISAPHGLAVSSGAPAIESLVVTITRATFLVAALAADALLFDRVAAAEPPSVVEAFCPGVLAALLLRCVRELGGGALWVPGEAEGPNAVRPWRGGGVTLSTPLELVPRRGGARRSTHGGCTHLDRLFGCTPNTARAPQRPMQSAGHGRARAGLGDGGRDGDGRAVPGTGALRVARPRAAASASAEPLPSSAPAALPSALGCPRVERAHAARHRRARHGDARGLPRSSLLMPAPRPRRPSSRRAGGRGGGDSALARRRRRYTSRVRVTPRDSRRSVRHRRPRRAGSGHERGAAAAQPPPTYAHGEREWRRRGRR